MSGVDLDAIDATAAGSLVKRDLSVTGLDYDFVKDVRALVAEVRAAREVVEVARNSAGIYAWDHIDAAVSAYDKAVGS